MKRPIDSPKESRENHSSGTAFSHSQGQRRKGQTEQMFSGLHLKAEATQGVYEYRDSAAASFDKFDHPFSSRFDEQDA